MSAVADEPRFTAAEWWRIVNDPTKDKTYQRVTRLGGVVAAYLAWKEMGATARTLEIYEPYFARLCMMYPDATASEITEEMLLEFLASYPAGSRRVVKTALSGFFRWASHPKRGHCVYNPIPELPALKDPPAKVYDVFSMAEQAKLVMAADQLPLPWVQRLRILCLIELGVRKDEGRHLRPSDFDASARVVLLREGVKNSKERVVPMSDELWKALMQFRNRPIPNVKLRDSRGEYREERQPTDSDFVFFPIGFHRRSGKVTWTRPYKQMSERGMHSWWERYVIPAAGIRYRSMHMARHTVGTDLASAEADSFTIRDWLGHADVSTTQVYVHNSRSRLQRGLERLDDYRKARGA